MLQIFSSEFGCILDICDTSITNFGWNKQLQHVLHGTSSICCITEGNAFLADWEQMKTSLVLPVLCCFCEQYLKSTHKLTRLPLVPLLVKTPRLPPQFTFFYLSFCITYASTLFTYLLNECFFNVWCLIFSCLLAQKHGYASLGAYPVSDTYPIRIWLGYDMDTYPWRVRVSQIKWDENWGMDTYPCHWYGPAQTSPWR